MKRESVYGKTGGSEEDIVGELRRAVSQRAGERAIELVLGLLTAYGLDHTPGCRRELCAQLLAERRAVTSSRGSRSLDLVA